MFKFIFPKAKGKDSLIRISIEPQELSQSINEQEFNEAFEKISGLVKDTVKTKINVALRLPIDKYEPNPPLPLSLYEKDEKLGNALLTGARFSFHKTQEDLKFALIDVSPCVDCEEVNIGIFLTLIRVMKITSNDVLSIIVKIEDYFKYFYKIRNEKQA
jgi:hypothetical protein